LVLIAGSILGIIGIGINEFSILLGLVLIGCIYVWMYYMRWVYLVIHADYVLVIYELLSMKLMVNGIGIGIVGI